MPQHFSAAKATSFILSLLDLFTSKPLIMYAIRARKWSWLREGKIGAGVSV